MKIHRAFYIFKKKIQNKKEIGLCTPYIYNRRIKKDFIKKRKEGDIIVTIKKFYPLITDKLFKAVFCTPGNEYLLKEFTERLLKRKFKTFKILSPELTKNNIYEKGKYLDILIKADNLFINIEINSHNYEGLDERNFSYIALVYASHLKVGEEYNNDLDFVQINLTVGLGTKKPEISVSRVINKDTLKLKVRNLDIYDVNLDKINNRCYNEDDEYNFLKMITASREELEFLAEKGDEFMKKIQKQVEKLNDENYFANFISVEEDERKIRNTYFANGKEEGEKRGEKRGKENALIETAKNLLKVGDSIQKISEVTGLSITKIKSLQGKLLQ